MDWISLAKIVVQLLLAALAAYQGNAVPGMDAVAGAIVASAVHTSIKTGRGLLPKKDQ